MPRRINNIFRSKIKFKYMYSAYNRAILGKKDTREVILFDMDLASNLISILRAIYNNKYIPGRYRKFYVYEPKKREIMSLPFRDRIVHQWYVEEFIKPIFIPKFICDSYACIEGRGTHKAMAKAAKYLKMVSNKNKEAYVLKCDISKFFYSIDKKILYDIIKRKVKDKDFLDITKTIIYSDGMEKGIPIGNYTSQFYANIYLNELDHYIKEVMKVKYYVRYMDDFVIILNSKDEIVEAKEKIKSFVENRLQLRLNSKTNYFKIKQGVTFLRIQNIEK